ncbi:MAG: ribosome recycling factor, partial [Actinomycetota bacterium]|nr:ribosome recycling factor [Actinomycetota bacterium]
MSDIMKEAERRMKKAVEVTSTDLASIRTGRANPALIERLSVNYYG